MKLIRCRHTRLIYALIVMQVYLLTSCNTRSYNLKNQDEKIGFLGFYLDMDYLKVRSKMDSLLNLGELYYFETTDMLENKQKNLYCDFSEISPFLSAKVNLRGTYIVDQRLTSIQLTLCSRSKERGQGFSYSCDLNELTRLFESYREKFGKPTLLAQGEKYDWLSKKIPNVYFPGPRGRWFMDKIYYWERSNYIIYFDFGYPENVTSSDHPVTESHDSELPDSTSAPIIYYDFTAEYLDKLLEKASK